VLRERFNKAPPQEAKLQNWQKRAFSFGSVEDRLRSGQRKTRLTRCAAVAASPLPKWTRKRLPQLKCATVNSAGSHEERLEFEAVSPIHKWTVVRSHDAVTHYWTLSRTPHPTRRLSSLMNVQFIAVPVTEILRFGLGRIRISWWNLNMMWAGTTATHLTDPVLRWTC
jgi:hypothetical protein